MKKYFENPEIELEKFHIEDIMTGSTPTEPWEGDKDEDSSLPL